MSNQQSFTRIENELVHEYRRNVSAAESANEVRQHFAHTVCALLAGASNDGIRCRHEDVTLQPATAPHYAISEVVTSLPAFQSVWKDSDLPAILQRLVDPAVHRIAHLAKHGEKTNSKIFHGR